jgi:L-fuculose-phosphate aldolase
MKQALGMIETKGIVALIQAADAMLKNAGVQLQGWKQIGQDCCAICVAGDIAAVQAAVDAGASAVKSIGCEIINTHVLTQPHEALAEILKTFEKALPVENAREATSTEIDRLFHSIEAMAIKEEICAVGRKLWQRSYVDGNGGNISYRMGEHAVICTPTLLSKADLKPEDLCLVDLEGNQLAGVRPRTSEVFLHLEIFKHVSQAKAVVHCHPPHATAYAITGHVPPPAIIPEFDVFVGSVAVTDYETPGTKKFAETVLPFVQNHNAILLGNHGVVCWADTPTHAEWYAENLETYCWTLLISKQLGVPYIRIPSDKEQDLLKIKKRLGLPDVRFDRKAGEGSEIPEVPGAIALAPPNSLKSNRPSVRTLSNADVKAIAKATADAVKAAGKRK